MMLGDRYQVFAHVDGCTLSIGFFDTWKQAKAARGNAFHRDDVKAAWVMRDNPSLGLRQDQYGFTLRKPQHE